MKYIKDYENLYSISKDGNIYSHPKQGSGGHNGKYLKADTKPNGYQTVTLVKDKIKKRFLIHRLVAEAYIENCENLPCINHKDGIKNNNNVENLEWCTWSENEQHSYDVLGKDASKHCLGKTGYDSTRGKEVGQFDLNNNLIEKYGSGSEAAKAIGGVQSSISAVCRGKRTKHKGFKWKYI